MNTTNVEKHLQTVIQIVLVPVVLWVGTSLVTLRDSSVRGEEKYTQIKETVADLKTEVNALRAVITTGTERDIAVYKNLQEMMVKMETFTVRLDQVERRYMRKDASNRSQP